MTHLLKLLNDVLTRYLAGPGIRELRTSFESLNSKAANLYAKAADLFERSAQEAELAQRLEEQEIGGISLGDGPTADDLEQASEASFKMAELADAMGDEIAEEAQMHFEQLENRIGPKRAALI